MIEELKDYMILQSVLSKKIEYCYKKLYLKNPSILQSLNHGPVLTIH